jgi:hypothetical protein
MHTEDERTLSPQERQQREFERKEKRSQKFREELGDFNDEMRAARGGYLSNKMARSVPHGEQAQKGALSSTFGGGSFGLGMINVNDIIDLFGSINKSVAAAFSSNAAVVAAPKKSALLEQHAYEDESYIYDTAMVSEKTAAELQREAAIITAKLRKLESAENPAIRQELALKIEELAEEFQMRLNPKTQAYVHNINRILELEEQYNPNNLNLCAIEVCVVRVKAEIGELRGVKRNIGDPYNKDIAEVLLNHDEKNAIDAARPVHNLH